MSFSDARVVEFYDPLSAGYDRMMDSEPRIVRAREFFKKIGGRFKFESVLDAGCGSGHFAIAAGLHGCRAVGVDLSSGMLDIARREAMEHDVQVDWRQGSLTELGAIVSEPVDLALCMGNTIPHLLDFDELSAACAGLFESVKPGGHAIIHLLNYEHLMATRERIVEINRSDDLEFVRFYDYWAPTLINFNMLTIDWSESPPKHTLNSVELHPYRLTELRQALLNAGFAACFPCGDLDLTPFHPHKSDVLVLVAMKGR